jgi:hypothetical protein
VSSQFVVSNDLVKLQIGLPIPDHLLDGSWVVGIAQVLLDRLPEVGVCAIAHLGNPRVPPPGDLDLLERPSDHESTRRSDQDSLRLWGHC